MDLKSSSITADILNLLSDCKVHTMKELADEIEVSERTIRRHIQSLTYRYPIQTFCGGINRGGVYLDKSYLYQGKTLTVDELQVINKALTLLQKCKDQNVNTEVIKNLINKFTPPPMKEKKDYGIRKEQTASWRLQRN